MIEILPRPLVALLARLAHRLGLKGDWIAWYVETADRDRVARIAAATPIRFGKSRPPERDIH